MCFLIPCVPFAPSRVDVPPFREFLFMLIVADSFVSMKNLSMCLFVFDPFVGSHEFHFVLTLRLFT